MSNCSVPARFAAPRPSPERASTNQRTGKKAAAAARLATPRMALLACLLVARVAPAQTAYPMLMSLRPVAIQAGSTAEVTVSARYNLYGAYAVLVSGTGVSGEVIPPETRPGGDGKRPATDKLRIRFSAAADAPWGVRDVRLGTPQGASTVGQLVVVPEPVVVESGPNDTPATALPVTLPAAICGTLEKNEDIDYYRFQAEQGQQWVFVTRCARLQDRIHDLQTHADPILTLRTAGGMTVAAADNHLYHPDPVLVWQCPQSGEYVLEIRDVRYQGNPYWEYCVEVSRRPHVECVSPLAVRPGQAVTFTLAGWGLPPGSQSLWQVPSEMPLGLASVPLPLGEDRTAGVGLLVTDLPLEAESAGEHATLEAAQPLPVPGGVCGLLAREGEADYYAFEARKGQALSLEVLARRLGSALDAHVRILDEKGRQLALNDDLRIGKRTTADAGIENWVPPADGRYIVEVRDVHLQGGPLYPYFLRITPSQPCFELYLDTDKTQVPRGGCGVLFVRIERKHGFDGEVQLAIDGLPEGVTASCGRILAGKGQDGCIVLEAAPEAALDIRNVVVRGTGQIKQPDGTTRPWTTEAVAYQEIYLPGGGRGHWPVVAHAVAVTEPGDIRQVQLGTHEVVLRPGQSQRIEVTIERSEGFNANVTLDMLMRHLNTVYANTLPPGVTLDEKQAQSLLAGSATQGYLTLVAARDAPPVEKQQAVVMAHVALNFVMKWTYASRPVTITVLPPEP